MKRIFVYSDIAVGAVVAFDNCRNNFHFFVARRYCSGGCREVWGPKLSGRMSELADVEISATSGKGALRGLVVGNPAPFKTESALNLGEISVSINPTTITGGTIVIKEIVIGSPEITYELDSRGSNIDAIQ